MTRFLISFVAASLLLCGTARGQFNAGWVFGSDLYQRYTNPVSGQLVTGRSSGSVFSLLFGGEVMAGAGNFSAGLQASVNVAPLAFDINEYKGLVAVSFPLLLKLNYGALSGFSEKITGGYLAGGWQYSRTEMFGLNARHKDIERTLFGAGIIEAGFGGGIGGLNAVLYTRLGFGPDKRRVFHCGFTTRTDFRTKKSATRKVKNPLSA